MNDIESFLLPRSQNPSTQKRNLLNADQGTQKIKEETESG